MAASISLPPAWMSWNVAVVVRSLLCRFFPKSLESVCARSDRLRAPAEVSPDHSIRATLEQEAASLQKGLKRESPEKLPKRVNGTRAGTDGEGSV